MTTSDVPEGGSPEVVKDVEKDRGMDMASRPSTSIHELAAEVGGLRARVEAAEASLARLGVADAILAIQDLKARYGDLVDQRFSRGQVIDDVSLRAIADQAAGLFTEDGTWDGGPALGVVHGRSAIAERLASPTLVFSRHLFLSPRIAVDGDAATGRWDLLSPCTRPDGSHWWICGFEDDTYRRIDGVWLHQTMRLTTVFVAEAGNGWPRILA